jgi:hypothetical protein
VRKSQIIIFFILIIVPLIMFLNGYHRKFYLMLKSMGILRFFGVGNVFTTILATIYVGWVMFFLMTLSLMEKVLPDYEYESKFE